MLAHLSPRLPGRVGDVADHEARGLEPANGLARTLYGLVSDVERPVQVNQQPRNVHAPMIAGFPGWRRGALVADHTLSGTERGQSAQQVYQVADGYKDYGHDDQDQVPPLGREAPHKRSPERQDDP
jgi:hypothetical protein